MPADALLVDLGVDLLLALRFRDRLGRALGRSLPATLVYDYPSVAAIVRALVPAIEVATSRLRIEPNEPIAIVGMACRTPGGVIDAGSYWALLREGRDAIGPFPERWDVDALYDPDPEAEGRATRAKEDFCAMWTSSMPAFSAFRHGKRCRWTRSSGWCWKWRGRRWSRRGCARGAE